MNTDDTSIANEERNIACLCHLASFSTMLGVPFGWILGPLLVWLWKRNEMPFVDEQGKEALNFQISMSIFMIIGIPLLILAAIPLLADDNAAGAIVLIGGICCLVALSLLNLVCTIIAAIKANNGDHYRYPMTFRFLS